MVRRTPFRDLSTRYPLRAAAYREGVCHLRCLRLVSQHVPREPIEVELIADVAFNLIEKAIDHLEISPP